MSAGRVGGQAATRPERLYGAYVFDMDGTIYLGDEVLPGVRRPSRSCAS